jgi:signal transduction histidine kinase
MRKLIFLFFLLIGFHAVFCQESLMQKTKKSVDSILTILSGEKDENKRLQDVLAIYTTSTEGFPSLMFEVYQKLYEFGQKNNDLITMSSAWSIAAQGYRLTGNYIKALECHHKAVLLAEQSGNPSLLGYAQNQMGHIYKDREENDKAITLYKTAATNIAKGNNEFLAAWPMMNLGAVYLNANQLDTSLSYSKRAYDIFIKYHLLGRGYIDYILFNIAGVYSKKGDTLMAMKYYEDAIAEAERNGSPRFTNNAYVAIAEHFYRYHKIDSCIFYCKKAIAMVKNTILINLSLKPAKLLTDIYRNSNADSTLKYLKVYTSANDSLYSTRANQQLQMMTFEEDQRQRDMALEKITYRNKIRTGLLLAGLGAICLIALILYRNNKQKHKSNKVLQKTLSELKSTQSQLIQAEKMASLGELTAGIAHEIQNPLNFVNNFSEVSNELIEEMVDEANKGNTGEVKAIANDLKQNLEKINHHGKRADAIVKGMLQHSRSSSGVKELTDINALCDEYLRLSYHGLRAKDNSFNATIKTDFDNSIGSINIIPQDMGRVILNLLTNAFYAVNEKKQQSIDGYEPTVTISTKKINEKIEIRVTDNGNGIPQKILGKIYQPFFTTKPTGQGTGLGLSLSYDIVTKGHGGKLIAETKELGGTQFIIQLSA